MRDFLESMFGETGGLVAQFVVTVVVVLGLIAIVYWLVRRVSGMRIGGIGRGRVPRLAIVDAMPIDSRRRLVLVRRDNVEHLIMIGGPSDLVVEPSIVRSRQRAPQQPVRPGQQPLAVAHPTPEPTPTPPPVRNPDPTGAEAPLPTPPLRGFGPAATLRGPTAHPFQRAVAPPTPAPPGDEVRRPPPAQPGEVARPTLVAPVLPEPREPAPPADGESFEPPLPEMVRPHAQAAAMPDRPEPVETGEAPADRDQLRLGLGNNTAAVGEGPTKPQDDGADRVSDLEQDMARLLGEINASRSSV